MRGISESSDVDAVTRVSPLPHMAGRPLPCRDQCSLPWWRWRVDPSGAGAHRPRPGDLHARRAAGSKGIWSDTQPSSESIPYVRSLPVPRLLSRGVACARVREHMCTILLITCRPIMRCRYGYHATRGPHAHTHTHTHACMPLLGRASWLQRQGTIASGASSLATGCNRSARRWVIA